MQFALTKLRVDLLKMQFALQNCELIHFRVPWEFVQLIHLASTKVFQRSVCRNSFVLTLEWGASTIMKILHLFGIFYLFCCIALASAGRTPPSTPPRRSDRKKNPTRRLADEVTPTARGGRKKKERKPWEVSPRSYKASTTTPKPFRDTDDRPPSSRTRSGVRATRDRCQRAQASRVAIEESLREVRCKLHYIDQDIQLNDEQLARNEAALMKLNDQDERIFKALERGGRHQDRMQVRLEQNNARRATLSDNLRSLEVEKNKLNNYVNSVSYQKLTRAEQRLSADLDRIERVAREEKRCFEESRRRLSNHMDSDTLSAFCPKKKSKKKEDEANNNKSRRSRKKRQLPTPTLLGRLSRFGASPRSRWLCYLFGCSG